MKLLLLSLIAFGLQAQPVALVTGASRGIGREVAELLVKDGYTVYGTSRSPGKNETTFHQIQLDVRDQSSIDLAIQKIMKQEGRIDVLVNNAGIAVSGSVENVTIEEAEEVFDVNFFGPMRMMQAVLPIMRAQNEGRIIQLSSRSGFRPFPTLGIYGASKFALEGLSETVAVTVKPWNIHISLIEPGPVNNDFDENISYGSKLSLENDPYKPLFEKAGLFELGSPIAQEPAEIAQVIKEAIKADKPHFRYQTSPTVKMQAELRYVDPTGDTHLSEWTDTMSPK